MSVAQVTLTVRATDNATRVFGEAAEKTAALVTRLDAVLQLDWCEDMARSCGRGLIEVGPREYVGCRRRSFYSQDPATGSIDETVAYEWIHSTGATVQVITHPVALTLLAERDA